MTDTTNMQLPDGYVEINGEVYDAEGNTMQADENGNWYRVEAAPAAEPTEAAITPNEIETGYDENGDLVVAPVVAAMGQPAAEVAAGVDPNNIPVGGPLDSTGHVMRSTDGTVAAGAMQPITNHILQSPNYSTSTVDRDNANSVRPGAVELDRDGNPLPTDQQSPDDARVGTVDNPATRAEAPILGNAGRVNTTQSLGS